MNILFTTYLYIALKHSCTFYIMSTQGILRKFASEHTLLAYIIYLYRQLDKMTSTGSNKEYNRIKGLPRQSVRNFVCAGAIPNIFIISYYFFACSKLNVIFHILFIHSRLIIYPLAIVIIHLTIIFITVNHQKNNYKLSFCQSI